MMVRSYLLWGIVAHICNPIHESEEGESKV